MNKGGIGGAGATEGAGGAGSGPTAAAASQKLKTLMQRVETGIIGNIVGNFTDLVNVARVSDLPVRNTRGFYDGDACSQNGKTACLVYLLALSLKTLELSNSQAQAADSLLKLVSELKPTAIFSGFASLNDRVDQRTQEFNQQAQKTDGMMAIIGEEAAASLKELESHYYSSAPG